MQVSKNFALSLLLLSGLVGQQAMAFDFPRSTFCQKLENGRVKIGFFSNSDQQDLGQLLTNLVAAGPNAASSLSLVNDPNSTVPTLKNTYTAKNGDWSAEREFFVNYGPRVDWKNGGSIVGEGQCSFNDAGIVVSGPLAQELIAASVQAKISLNATSFGEVILTPNWR